MAEDLKIANAYVEFSTKGDITPEVQRQSEVAKRFADAQEALQGHHSGPGSYKDEAKRRWESHAAQQEADAAAASAKAKKESAQAQREKDAADREATQNKKVQQIADIQVVNTQAAKFNNLIGQVGQALGGLPGVGKAASVAHQGVYGYQAAKAEAIAAGKTGAAAEGAGLAGGLKGAGVAAIVTAISTGIEGAFKANPQAKARLDYEGDRLQAALGQTFIPLIEAAGRGLEKFNNFIGAQAVNRPQYSDFASIRDRLQIAALMGQAPNPPGSVAARTNSAARDALAISAAGPFGGFVAAGRAIMNALD